MSEASLTQLGQRTELPSSPREAVIECVIWRPSREGQLVSCRFTCPEFTSLCPITGQPDFARIVIDYVPNKLLVESKSLKLFLNSFRSEGSFHEQVVDLIGQRLQDAASPLWIRVAGLFYPRGGIPLDIVWSAGEIPKTVEVPSLPMSEYRGR